MNLNKDKSKNLKQNSLLEIYFGDTDTFVQFIDRIGT